MGWIDNRDMRDKGYEGPLAIEVVDSFRPSIKSKEEAEQSMIEIMNDDVAQFEKRIHFANKQIEHFEDVIVKSEDSIEQIKKRLKQK